MPLPRPTRGGGSARRSCLGALFLFVPAMYVASQAASSPDGSRRTAAFVTFWATVHAHSFLHVAYAPPRVVLRLFLTSHNLTEHP